MRNLITYLETFHPLSEDLKHYLNEKVVQVSFPSGHVLLDVPKVASHVYYLQDGLGVSYSFTREGKITEHFWKPGQLMIAFESFFYQRPTLETLQLLKASDLLCLSYEALEELFTRFPEANIIYRHVMNLHYLKLGHQLKLQKHGDGANLYHKFLQDFPGIERNVTQQSIANYLGITPQNLARIKRKEKR
ncbi:MAG: Crp/Fnr family transcriptional regulator [Cyclobacteriaceae bacterium]|nr:Crp/Fnr family transcriptional regulator [Cyclobacteriaceae bacterium]